MDTSENKGSGEGGRDDSELEVNITEKIRGVTPNLLPNRRQCPQSCPDLHGHTPDTDNKMTAANPTFESTRTPSRGHRMPSRTNETLLVGVLGRGWNSAGVVQVNSVSDQIALALGVLDGAVRGTHVVRV